MKFNLQGEEYIELIKLLKFLGIAESGGDAKQIVENGDVIVNDEVEFRKRKKLRSGDIVEIGDETIEIL